MIFFITSLNGNFYRAEHEEAERLRLELQFDQQRRAATIEHERAQAAVRNAPSPSSFA